MWTVTYKKTMMVLMRKVSLRDGHSFSAGFLKVQPFNHLTPISWLEHAHSWVHPRPTTIRISGSQE